MMKRHIGCLLAFLMCGSEAIAAQPVVTPGPSVSSTAVAGPTPYNFFDTFSGTQAVVSGRTPDTVSNGSTWIGTGANVANYKAGGGALYAIAGSGVAYAVMHTTCTGAPQEVGGTFTYSGSTTTTTIASMLSYASWGLGDMAHFNIAGSGASILTATLNLWSTNPPNTSAFTLRGGQWVSPTSYGVLAPNTSYNYREFYNGNQITLRVEVAATGVVVGEFQGMDPEISTVDGPDVFFEVGDTTTEWTAAWARCASTSNTQTTLKIPGGIYGPIAPNGDTADANFLSIVSGYNPTTGSVLYRKSGSQFFTQNGQFLQVVGQGYHGVLQVGSDTSGYQGEIDVYNGASFPTAAASGKTALIEDSSYNFSVTTNSTTWLRYVFNGLPDMVVPWTLAGPYSAAGTALPTCSSTYKGAIAYVTDATSPTYNGSYTSGGAVVVPVFCSGTAPWTTH